MICWLHMRALYLTCQKPFCDNWLLLQNGNCLFNNSRLATARRAGQQREWHLLGVCVRMSNPSHEHEKMHPNIMNTTYDDVTSIAHCNLVDTDTRGSVSFDVCTLKSKFRCGCGSLIELSECIRPIDVSSCAHGTTSPQTRKDPHNIERHLTYDFLWLNNKA